MMKTFGLCCFLLSLLALSASTRAVNNTVRVQSGLLEGGASSVTGVRVFKGVPYAAPPVGELRWRPPQPPAKWEGVRKVDRFGPRCMQRQIFGDMGFRSNGMSEDCLYLNVWTPAKTNKEKLPELHQDRKSERQGGTELAEVRRGTADCH
jgi:para-nitrobenzyl esterase